MARPVIPFVDLKTQYSALRGEIGIRIQRVLDHGQYIMGPEIAELEERLSSYVGSKHCVAVSSGTDALLIAMMALDIRPGDEVITTPFTFIATAEMITLLGATPVFVDIQPQSYNIDPCMIERAINERTRAILPVSLYGQCSDMDAINEIAGRYNVPVIEDGAQSFGATCNGRLSCSLSTIGATSFFPSKPLGCYGDGGALFTNDQTMAEAMREIRAHGQSRRYYHTRIGLNGRMDTLQAAILLAKLERFPWEVQRRQEIGARYSELLSALGPKGILVPSIAPGHTSVYAQYTVRVSNREQVINRMTERGIPTAVHYPIPLHMQPAFVSDTRVDGMFPEAERAAETVVSLPMSADLTDSAQSTIVKALLECVSD